MRILFPMVSSALEMEQARALCAEVCAELAGAGVAHDPGVPLGAMIETPSAAMTADHLAAVADFLSIGTNDLIHYAFAADRDDDAVAYLYRPMHPSILRLLRHIFEGAAKHGCPVSMCGEMAGNLHSTWILLGLGLRSFSMTAAALPAMKSLLRKTELGAARALARDALQLTSDEAVAALARERMGDRFLLELDDAALH
jgi:phosphotransferase system enzyme I (PtsI)